MCIETKEQVLSAVRALAQESFAAEKPYSLEEAAVRLTLIDLLVLGLGMDANLAAITVRAQEAKAKQDAQQGMEDAIHRERSQA